MKKEKPLTIAELFGKNNLNEIQMRNNKNYQNKKNKNKKSNKKVHSNVQKSENFIEPKTIPTSGVVNIGIIKFTSDGKDYNFLISDKLDIEKLKEMLTKQEYVVVNVWSNPKKNGEPRKELGFLKEIKNIDLDKLSKDKKPTAWIYRICKNQENKKIQTNKEKIEFFVERRKRKNVN